MKTYKEIYSYLINEYFNMCKDDDYTPKTSLKKKVVMYYLANLKAIAKSSKNESCHLLNFKILLKNDLELNDCEKIVKVSKETSLGCYFLSDKAIISILDECIKKIFIYAFGN